MTDTRFSLRRDVYQSLVAAKGAKTIVDQVKLTGVPRRSLYRILDGEPPSPTNILRLTNALEVPIHALFEQVAKAA